MPDTTLFWGSFFSNKRRYTIFDPLSTIVTIFSSKLYKNCRYKIPAPSPVRPLRYLRTIPKPSMRLKTTTSKFLDSMISYLIFPLTLTICDKAFQESLECSLMIHTGFKRLKKFLFENEKKMFSNTNRKKTKFVTFYFWWRFFL